jgi:tRNA pseudouridine55 synthase
VFELDLLEFLSPTARIRLRCSAGTYLRGIAHEVGRELGCGAFLTALRRTASGEFTEDRALTLEALGELARDGDLGKALIPAAQVLPEFPEAAVDTVTAGQIRHGKDFRLSPFVERAGAKYVKAVSPEGDLIAIGEVRLPHVYHPILVL